MAKYPTALRATRRFLTVEDTSKVCPIRFSPRNEATAMTAHRTKTVSMDGTGCTVMAQWLGVRTASPHLCTNLVHIPNHQKDCHQALCPMFNALLIASGEKVVRSEQGPDRSLTRRPIELYASDDKVMQTIPENPDPPHIHQMASLKPENSEAVKIFCLRSCKNNP